MNKRTSKCPVCGGTDLDRWPEDAPFAYCYTCKASVQFQKNPDLNNVMSVKK
jgi:hypothetical protein